MVFVTIGVEYLFLNRQRSIDASVEVQKPKQYAGIGLFKDRRQEKDYRNRLWDLKAYHLGLGYAMNTAAATIRKSALHRTLLPAPLTRAPLLSCWGVGHVYRVGRVEQP